MTDSADIDTIKDAHMYLCDIYDLIPYLLTSIQSAITAYDNATIKDPVAREALIVVKTAIEHLSKHLIAADEPIGTVIELERPWVTDKRPRLSQRETREDHR